MNTNKEIQDDTQSLQSCVSVSALIAEFLGSKYINDAPEDYPNGYYYQPADVEDECPTGNPEEWSFNSSWDWLMPVVEKIELKGYDSRICGNNSDGGFLCDFVDFENTEKGIGISFETKIEAVFLAVGDFLRNRV